MGVGTATGVQSPEQPGVITPDGANLPFIPEKLLRLSPDKLQGRIDRVSGVLARRYESIIPDYDLIERLEQKHVVLIFAKSAVERQMSASKERLG